MAWTYRFQEGEIDGLYVCNDFDLELIWQGVRWRLESARHAPSGVRASVRQLAVFCIWLDDPFVQGRLTAEHDEELAERAR